MNRHIYFRKLAARLDTGLFRISTQMRLSMFCMSRKKHQPKAGLKLISKTLRLIRQHMPRDILVVLNDCSPYSLASEYRNRMVAVAVTAAPRHVGIIA